MKETAKHVEAFEVWFNSGEILSYQKASDRLTEMKRPASTTSLKKWATAFDWKKRADERIAAVNQRLEVEAVDDITKAKKQMIAVVDLSLARIAQALTGEPITCPNCGEIVHVSKVSYNVKDVAALVTAKLRLIDDPEKFKVEGMTLVDLVALAGASGE